VQCGPGRAGDQIAVDEGFGHGETDVRAAAECDVGAGGWIRAAFFPLEDSRDSENLWRVADGGKRFVGF